MGKTEKRIKLGATALCELFTGYTLIMLLTAGEPDRLALAFGTLLLAALPLALEKLLSCRISLPLYLFALAYAIGPMLGHCWKLYYSTVSLVFSKIACSSCFFNCFFNVDFCMHNIRSKA